MTVQKQQAPAKRRRGQAPLASFLLPPGADERRQPSKMLGAWRFLADRYDEAHTVYRQVQEQLADTSDAKQRKCLETQAAMALEFIDTIDIALGRQPVPVSVDDPMAAVRKVLEERAAPRAVVALEEVLEDFVAQSWDVDRLSPTMKRQARVALFPWTIVIDEDQEQAFSNDLDDFLRSFELEDLLLEVGPQKTACAVLAAVRGQSVDAVRDNFVKARNISKRFGNRLKSD